MSRILVVEDELHLAEGLRFNLEARTIRWKWWRRGRRRSPVAAGSGAVRRGGAGYHAARKDGFTVMRELRRAGQFIPTLMLTARGHAEDILQGFEAGADDYLTKPFELAILIARIRGLLRRREWLTAALPAAPRVEEGDTFTFGE